MKPSVLNLLALRDGNWPVTRLPGLALEAALDAISGKTVTRRGFLALSGAALGTSAASLATHGAVLGPFEMAGDSKRTAFLMGGRERWVIDTSLFAGEPQLRVSRGKQRIRLALKNARFPGTNLPADFVSELQPTLLGWKMKIRLKAGEFQSEVPFERWLMGEVPAISRLKLNGKLCDLAEGRSLVVSSPAMAEFHPNWALRVEGPGVAEVLGVGTTALRSDAAAVSLLTSKEPSILAETELKRTLVALDRGSHSWDIAPVLRTSPDGKMIAGGSLFDRISIEAGELRSGLVAESLSDISRLVFEPGQQFAGHDGETFQMPLHRPRYAVTWDANGEESALVAQFPKEPAWLHTNGCALQIGHVPGGPQFEWMHGGGELQSLQCAVPVIRAAIPMPGAIVEATAAAPGSLIDLFAGAPNNASDSDNVAGQSTPLPPPKGGNLGLTDPFTTVIRPDDLLCLGFKFTNFTLTFGSTPQLTRTDPNQAAYITVIFQPQHIGEQALYQTPGPGFVLGQGDSSSSDALINPPLAARIAGLNPITAPSQNAVNEIAGASRLVFAVPSGINQIPYTLQSLLDWTKFDLKVAGNALPVPIRHIAATAAPSQISATTGVRQIAPKRPLPIVPVAKNVGPVASPNSPQFIADFPAVVENILKSNPQALSTMPALAQSWKSIKSSSARPTPQTIQAAAQLAQQLSTVLPNLGNIVAQSLAIQLPDAQTTSIEAPYRLMISPSVLAAWAHKVPAPGASVNGWTELWHTRLGVKQSDGTANEVDSTQRIIRAIWSPDWTPQYSTTNPPHYQGSGIRMSLDANDRCQLVELSSDWLNLQNQGKYVAPEAVQVNRLMLSSLGVWLDSHGAWQTADKLNVTDWIHRAQMGRDSYVRVVYQGYLFPFGHGASLIKVSERKFARDPNGDMTAYLRQRMYVVVRQPEKTYPVPGQPNQGREFPFQRVQVITKSTPDLDDPTQGPGKLAGQDIFWPYVSGQPFRFHAVLEDNDGNTADLNVPMIFVSSPVAFSPQTMGFLVGAYGKDGLGPDSRRSAAVGGAKFTYAASVKPGDTNFPTTGLTFGGIGIPGSVADDQPAFYPTIAAANVSVPAIAHLLGTGVPTDTQIVLDPTYITAGFPPPNAPMHSHPNMPAVFARLLNSVGMDFAGNGAGDKGGGVVSPSMQILGLSRILGPVGGDATQPDPLAEFKSGNFNPKTIFAGMASAQLLGGISLQDVIAPVPLTFLESDPGSPAVKINTQVNYPNGNTLAPPQSIDTIVRWTPTLTSNAVFIASTDPDIAPTTAAALAITANLHKDMNGSAPLSDITGDLTNFTLSFFGALKVGFSQFHFESRTGQKVTVQPKVATVKFGGSLSFVNALQDMLKRGGGSWGGGLSIDVEPSGINISYTLTLPDIAVGVMSLQNLGFGAALSLPFTGDPATLTFLFCSKAKPFIMSYCGFAGGGFFAITVALDGLKSVEISLWFGGSLAINLGVASGGVHMMAGIDLILAGTDITATAFIQLGGSLNVLGIITLSLEFDVSLTYYPEDPATHQKDVLIGQCTLTVQIDVACFSKSVDLTVERVITSGGGVNRGRLEPLAWQQPQWGGGAEPGQTRTLPSPRRNALSSPQAPAFTQLMDEPTWEKIYLAAFAA